MQDDSLLAQWGSHCREAGLREAGALGAQLIAAYGAPHRHYHGHGHLAFLFREIETRRSLIGDVALLCFAAWFHDAIYDPKAQDNEEHSAAWALQALPELGAAPGWVRSVEALILKTKSHLTGPAGPDEALFLDMDFAVIGAPVSAYRQYAQAIRAEYSHLPDAVFRIGRSAFLANVLAQPRMFHTEIYEDLYGAQARANLADEIALLSA